jgi:hypothetical protein
MSASGKPLPEDVLVCRWRDWLAIAVHDDARAAAFARHLHSLADKVELTLKYAVSAPAAREQRTDDERFHGYPLESKYSGKCAVCGRAYRAGDPILWDRDAKKSAHVECGVARR